MKISKYVMLTSALMLGGCGGGSPDDIPDNMALFFGIDGFSATGRGCTVTSGELSRFLESQMDCHDIIDGDGDTRSIPLASGMSSFALEDVKEFFIADITNGDGIATYNTSELQEGGGEVRAGSLGHSRKPFQLVSESRGDVANPFTTIVALMDSSMTIDDIGGSLSLSPSLLSSNYLTFIEEGEGSPNYQDALFAQAVGRGIISILPEYLGEREGAVYYRNLMEDLIDKATLLEDYIAPEELSFVINTDSTSVSPIRAPYSFENAVDFVQSEGREWRIVDLDVNSQNLWGFYDIYATNGKISIRSTNKTTDYDYQIDGHHSVRLANSGITHHIERFFYASEDVMFSDELMEEGHSQVNGTLRVWLNDTENFLDGTSIDESDFENGQSYYMMFVNPSEMDGDENEAASLSKVTFSGYFKDEPQDNYPSSCLHRGTEADINPIIGSHRHTSLEVRTKCGSGNNEPNVTDNDIRFVHSGSGSEINGVRMREIMNNDEMIILRDTEGGELKILFKDEHLAFQVAKRWDLFNQRSHY